MANPPRLCVIGIDALDPDLLQKWKADLPTFRRLMEQGGWARLQSTFPPDSIPAWTTIYTGVDPSEHGALEYINYMDIRQGPGRINNERLRGKTFWDRVSDAGYRVTILNPFMAYPSWPVNGLMVSGPVLINGDVSIEPVEAPLIRPLPELGGMVDFPNKRTLESFYKRCEDVTMQQAQFFAETLRSTTWDLSYVLFLTLDRVKHFYWRFDDEQDPYHERVAFAAKPIKKFYQLMDGIVGRLLQEAGPETATLVISDHGHQRRCTRLFYINELLRRTGYLDVPRGLGALTSPGVILERTKNFVLDLAFAFKMEDWLSVIAQVVPRRKALKRGDHVIRSDRSVARTSSFAGVNPFGGITINERALLAAGKDRATVVQDIVALLRGVTDKKGVAVVKWCLPREEAVPAGARLEAYPDVLFELLPEYGVSWSVFRPLFGPNITHRKISGGHTRDGTILSQGPVTFRSADPPKVADIHSIVLTHFGI
jgi:predicted AlkP superfamily phosphohydrolase/phosphomutase